MQTKTRYEEQIKEVYSSRRSTNRTENILKHKYVNTILG